MKYKSGEEFLNLLYKNMHMSDIVMHTASKGDTPVKKIEKYMDRLDKIHDIAKTNEHKMNLLKEMYYKKYVIKKLPEDYVELQKKIAFEEGRGYIDVNDTMKNQMLLNIQNDQKKSLDRWIEYFCSDDAMYPMWFKNYAFQGMLKLGKYDKEKRAFAKRVPETVEPYLSFNMEIIAQIYSSLKHEIGENTLTEEEQEALQNGESFQKLYIYYLNKTADYVNDGKTDGIWIKYNQGDNYYPLWESLQEKNTGWCTAGESTCKTQLAGGDFYVYYTKDKNNEYKNPRIAIRMDGKDSIGEVRGVGPHQELEEQFIDIADKKLDEFPNKRVYRKKVHDMRLITKIYKRTKNNIELSREELMFLSEINEPIEGFGYEKDPRVLELQLKELDEIEKKSKNNIELSREELLFIYGATCDNILKIVNDEAFTSRVVEICNAEIFDKKLDDLSNEDIFQRKVQDTRLLTEIQQKVNNHIELSQEDLKFLYEINKSIETFVWGGDLRIQELQNVEIFDERLDDLSNKDSFQEKVQDTRLLVKIREKANNNEVLSKDEVLRLYEITGFLSLFDRQRILLNDIKKKRNLKSDLAYVYDCKEQNIGTNVSDFEKHDIKVYYGYLNYYGRVIDKSFSNLEIIIGTANFHNIKNATYLNKLKNITLDAYFSNLVDATGLNSLQNIGQDAVFSALKDSKGLDNLTNVGGSMRIESLENYESLKKCNYYDDIKRSVENRLLFSKRDEIVEVDKKTK